jgi:hypothetical protein
MVVVLAIATLSTPTAAAVIGRTPTTAPPVSSSASGGMSRSCIHKFSLVAVLNFSEGCSRLPYIPQLGLAPILALPVRCAKTPMRLEKILNDLLPLKRLEPEGAEGQHGKRGR